MAPGIYEVEDQDDEPETIGGALPGPVEPKEKNPDPPDSETDLVKKFDKDNEPPEDWKEYYDAFQSDVEYMNEQIRKTINKDSQKVVVPHILRHQYVRLAQLYQKTPEFSVHKAKRIERRPSTPEEAAMKAASMAAAQDFAETALIIGEKLSAAAGINEIIEGAIQDASTCAITWVNVSWCEDITRDPLGNIRPNDFTDTLARLKSLKRDFDDKVFDRDSHQFKSMMDLADTVGQHLSAEAERSGIDQLEALTGERILASTDLTEIPRWAGPVYDPFLPSDIRMAWTLKRPEHWWLLPWISYMVTMTKDQIKDEFGVDDEYFTEMAPGESVSGQDVHKVWCRQDRSAGRIYIWAEGCKGFLRNDVPSCTTSKWYSLRPLYWNRVTGRPVPVSEVTLSRDLQDGMNRYRTHDRAGKGAAYNKYVVSKDFFTPDEKDYLQSCPPEGVIECDRANEIDKHFIRIPAGTYDPRLYDDSRERRDLEMIWATPSAASGVTGTSDFAIEASIANEQMQINSGRIQGRVELFHRDLMEATIELANHYLPEDQAKIIAGPGGVWPRLDRVALWRGFVLDVKTGSSSRASREKETDWLKNVAAIMKSLGLVPDPENITRLLLRAADLRMEPEEFLATLEPMMPMPSGPTGPGKEPDRRQMDPAPPAAPEQISQPPEVQ